MKDLDYLTARSARNLRALHAQRRLTAILVVTAIFAAAVVAAIYSL